MVIAWHNPSNTPTFTIDGKNSASPDKLAKALEIALDNKKALQKTRKTDPFYWWG